MNRKHLAVLLVALVAGLLLVLMLRERQEKTVVSPSVPPSPTSTPGLPANSSPVVATSVAGVSPRPKSQIEARAEAVKMVQTIYSAPISFYGKVEDQFGQPVPNAKVDYSAVDKFWGPASNYHGQADGNGNFFITGIQGAGLTVGVSKEGYDVIDGKSFQAFGYGMGVDEYRQKPPTQDNPAILVLRKKAKAEPLISISANFRVPKNGSPVEINLKTGGQVSGQGDLEIECWTADQNKDAHHHYEWHCRFSVPGGGIVERGDQLDQQAPVDEYKPSIEFEMAQDAQPWRPSVGGDYFLKLGNGSYARARLQMVAGGDHFATVESYLNPNPGDRDLEYDPQMQSAAK